MKEVRKEKRKKNKKYLVGLISVFGVLLILVGTIYNSYAYLEPVKNISFTSQNLNYSKQDPGSIQVKKVQNGLAKERHKLPLK